MNAGASVGTEGLRGEGSRVREVLEIRADVTSFTSPMIRALRRERDTRGKI